MKKHTERCDTATEGRRCSSTYGGAPSYHALLAYCLLLAGRFACKLQHLVPIGGEAAAPGSAIIRVDHCALRPCLRVRCLSCRPVLSVTCYVLAAGEKHLHQSQGDTPPTAPPSPWAALAWTMTPLLTSHPRTSVCMQTHTPTRARTMHMHGHDTRVNFRIRGKGLLPETASGTHSHPTKTVTGAPPALTMEK